MSKPASTTIQNDAGAAPKKTYFEQQRDLLIRDVGASMEHVLQNINKLNRSLEGIISVGNEFSSVEALWSHFENVMAKDEEGDVVQVGDDGVGGEEGMATSGRSDASMKK